MENETKNKKKTTSTANNKTSKKTTTTTKKKASVKKSTSAANKKVGVKKNSVVENMKAVKPTTQKEVTPVKVEKKETTKKVEETVQPKAYTKSDVKLFLDSEIGSLVKIVLIIAGVILVFLLITNIINSYKDDSEGLVTSGEIQYDEILVSNILNQSNSSYYVLVYDEDDLYYDTYNLYLTAYKDQENAIRVYTSVLSNGFNRKYYVTDESNVVGSSIENLKFKGTTLVRVENGAITSAYETPDTIIEHLKSIQD